MIRCFPSEKAKVGVERHLLKSVKCVLIITMQALGSVFIVDSTPQAALVVFLPLSAVHGTSKILLRVCAVCNGINSTYIRQNIGRVFLHAYFPSSSCQNFVSPFGYGIACERVRDFAHQVGIGIG